ncbi:MAG: hypothetical protein ABIQ97_06855 [Lysobacteraceae bacterium]
MEELRRKVVLDQVLLDQWMLHLDDTRAIGRLPISGRTNKNGEGLTPFPV